MYVEALIPNQTKAVIPNQTCGPCAEQELVLERMQGDKELGMARTIILWDLNRVKYMMRTYLRTRLQKIEKYVMHILDSEEMRDCLSEKEYQFAQVRLPP